MTRKSYYAEARRLTRKSDLRPLARAMRRMWRRIRFDFLDTHRDLQLVVEQTQRHGRLVDTFSEQLPVGSFPAILRDDC